MTKQSPQIGIGVLVFRQGKLLLGKRLNSHGSGLWAPPGGHLEFGESPQEAAHRELLEETDLRLENLRFVGLTNSLIENKHYVTLFFAGDSQGQEPKLCESHKCAGWEWFAMDNLPEPLFSTLTHLLEESPENCLCKLGL